MLTFVDPPMVCVLCGIGEGFTSKEHIIPHSLGNDLLVLPEGWVCDACNSACSKFESVALGNSILGLERCRLGVVTKKGKAASSTIHGVRYIGESHGTNDRIQILHTSKKSKTVWREKSHKSLEVAFPLHDSSCYSIAKLMLKMSLELMAVYFPNGEVEKSEYNDAKRHVVDASSAPWPYFIIRSDNLDEYTQSLFIKDKFAKEYLERIETDVAYFRTTDQMIFVFKYGNFRAAISMLSRTTQWTFGLIERSVAYVGCPVEFASESFEPKAAPPE